MWEKIRSAVLFQLYECKRKTIIVFQGALNITSLLQGHFKDRRMLFLDEKVASSNVLSTKGVKG